MDPIVVPSSSPSQNTILVTLYVTGLSPYTNPSLDTSNKPPNLLSAVISVKPSNYPSSVPPYVTSVVS